MNTKQDIGLTRYAYAKIPLSEGQFEFTVYRTNRDNREHLAISQGDLTSDEPVFARIHSACLTSEAFGSRKCDCAFQLEQALKTINKLGRGLVIYIAEEGRGIGLGNKIKAYSLQNQGHDTISANHHLGFPTDLRDFKLAGEVLKDLEINRIILNSNNPQKKSAIEQAGITIESIAPSLAPVTEDNHTYLLTKKTALKHILTQSELTN